MRQIKTWLAELPQVWLMPGELFVAQETSLITTILGSCITVCLFYPRQIAGAMCHCLIPSGELEPGAHSYRYVNSTLPKMLQKLNNLGVPYNEMQAKLFGGAVVTGKNGERQFSSSIGLANVAMARQVLQKHHVPIVAECVAKHLRPRWFFLLLRPSRIFTVSCVVFGMPQVAIKMGAVNEIVHLNKLAGKISEI